MTKRPMNHLATPPDCSATNMTTIASRRVSCAVTLLIITLFPSVPAARADETDGPRTAAELYQLDKVWTIHLHFTPEQWDAMEPKGAGRGPGGPGGGPRGGFGPGMFLAPVFLAQ